MACEEPGLRGYECTLTMDGATVARAINVEPEFTFKEMDVTTRYSGGWDQTQTGRAVMTASIEGLWVPSNAALQRIEQAARARENIEWKMQDAEGYGWNGCCVITRFGVSPRNLDDPIGFSVDIKSNGYVKKICGDGAGGSVACGSTYGNWGSGQ